MDYIFQYYFNIIKFKYNFKNVIKRWLKMQIQVNYNKFLYLNGFFLFFYGRWNFFVVFSLGCYILNILKFFIFMLFFRVSNNCQYYGWLQFLRIIGFFLKFGFQGTFWRGIIVFFLSIFNLEKIVLAIICVLRWCMVFIWFLDKDMKDVLINVIFQV